jgi:DMSO/TMAO reductase YedYZ molybdopterin-dependent catalytic subunit
VSAVLFQLVTGLLNIAAWYSPMPFAFLTGHYWTAWLAIGALALHVAVKLPIIRAALTHPAPAPGAAARTGSLTRRGLLGAAAAAVGVVTLSTVGQTVAPLAPLSALAPRRPTIGPQGLPVNNSARSAGVVTSALQRGYRLAVRGPGGEVSYSLAELAALPQVTVRLPITCVEGWSAGGVWTGIRVADLMARVGGVPGRHRVRVNSLQRGSGYSSSVLDVDHAGDPLTLVALRLNGEVLHLDHGYPARLIAPNRPGVLQTKWLSSVEVLT